MAKKNLMILPLAACQNYLPPAHLLAQFSRLPDGLGMCQVYSRISSFASAIPLSVLLPLLQVYSKVTFTEKSSEHAIQNSTLSHIVLLVCFIFFFAAIPS